MDITVALNSDSSVYPTVVAGKADSFKADSLELSSATIFAM